MALHGAKGVFSFRREYPLLNPQRKARGVPLDPRHCKEGLHALRSVGAVYVAAPRAFCVSVHAATTPYSVGRE